MQDHLQPETGFQTKLITTVKYITLAVASLSSILAFVFYSTGNENNTRIVAITQIIQHPSLDLIRKGLLDELNKNNLVKNNKIKIIFENAHGSISTAAQISQKFVGLEPEVIIAITTPSAQSIHSAIRGKNIPLVFSAVTDPISANLVKDLDQTIENVTGTIDLPPIKLQLALLKKIVPKIKRIGIVYNPGEINAVKQIEKLEFLAKKEKIEIVKSQATKSTEVYTAASRLVGLVDAFYLPNDNTVISAVESIVRVANENHIPTLASDDQSVTKGVLVSLANSQYDVGTDTGKIVIRILNGEPAGKIPVYISNNPKIIFNTLVAKKFKVETDQIKIENLTP